MMMNVITEEMKNEMFEQALENKIMAANWRRLAEKSEEENNMVSAKEYNTFADFNLEALRAYRETFRILGITADWLCYKSDHLN